MNNFSAYNNKIPSIFQQSNEYFNQLEAVYGTGFVEALLQTDPLGIPSDTPDNIYISRPDFVISTDNRFARNIADDLESKFIAFEKKSYGDGSPAPRVIMTDIETNHTYDYGDFEGSHILVVYRRKDNPDEHSVSRHLSMLQRLAANLMNFNLFNADQVDVLEPYWITGRQDHNPRYDPDPTVREMDRGMGVEYENDAIFLKAAGATRVLTWHPHFHRKPGITYVRGLQVACLDAVSAMQDYATKNLNISNGRWVIAVPGDKAMMQQGYDVAMDFATGLNLPIEFIPMKRIDERTKTADVTFDAKGNNVLIVDDIAATLGTLKTVRRRIVNAGEVRGLVVSPVFPRRGLDTLDDIRQDKDYPIIDVVGTNNIKSAQSYIPVEAEIQRFYDGDMRYRLNPKQMIMDF